MDDKITELYKSSGVVTDGFEHAVRKRWNESTNEVRNGYMDRVSGHRFHHNKRWDHIPYYLQSAILRIIKLDRKRREQSDNKTTKPA